MNVIALIVWLLVVAVIAVSVGILLARLEEMGQAHDLQGCCFFCDWRRRRQCRQLGD